MTIQTSARVDEPRLTTSRKRRDANTNAVDNAPSMERDELRQPRSGSALLLVVVGRESPWRERSR
jgi:hypothetical protein